MRFAALGLLLLSTSPALAARPAAGPSPEVAAIAMPGGEAGIGFDDLVFSSTLGKLLVPAGRTGMLDLVDLSTGKVASIPGFTVRKDFPGGHDDGVTSVAEGEGLLFREGELLGGALVGDVASGGHRGEPFANVPLVGARALRQVGGFLSAC